MKGRFEILSPGGSLEGIKATINAGADAVYTGGKLFGAREYADNLDVEQMKEALNFAHLRDRKIFLTVNTLLKDSEIEGKLYDYLYPFYNMGIDAVIVQDFGVMKFIHDCFEKLPIHASTQMCIMGSDTANWLKNYNVSRIVTPRELSLKEIKNIYDETGLEIESFVHGALCYSYSGVCMLSSFIGGRSGNRGKCAQPCRLDYDVFKGNKLLNPGNSKYVLSPKDICTFDMLKELDEAGVYSLKIEGRMKKPEYAAGVTEIYRKYADIYYENRDYKIEDRDYRNAMNLFNRNGFSKSYYTVHNSKDMISLKKPEFRQEDKELTDRISDNFINKDEKVQIKLKCEIKEGLPVKLTSVYKNFKVETLGRIPFEAKSRPIDADTVKSKLSKVGETDFSVLEIEVEIDDNLFLTIGALNELRRKNLFELKQKILSDFSRNDLKNKKTDAGMYCVFEDNLSVNKTDKNNDNDIHISILVSSVKQFLALPKCSNIKRVYLESETIAYSELKEISGKKGDVELFLAMPRVFRLEDKKSFLNKYPDLSSTDGFLIRNIEEYFFVKKNFGNKKTVFDYTVYAFNNVSKSILNNMSDMITIPLELNEREIEKLGTDGEMICYGYMPVMTTANCLNKTCASCNSGNDVLKLKDRKGYLSNVRCVCDYCYNVIYNCKPLSLLNYSDRLSALNINNIRLDFTFESDKEVSDIADRFISCFVGKEQVEDITDSTRGHFKRGVM